MVTSPGQYEWHQDCLLGHCAVVSPTEVIESRSGGVGNTIAFTAGLDPDESVGELGAGVGRRTPAETNTLLVAPVAPFLLASGLLSGAA